MTPSFDVAAYLKDSTEKSNVPYHLEDPYVMGRIVEMFASTKKAPAVVAAKAPVLPKE